ncbi:MAG: hypothetical protein WKF58_16625 [Ilumatobacteraceae bacterium]
MSLQAGRRLTAALVVAATVLAACSGDDQPDSSGAGSEPASGSDVVAGEAFPESRCEANRAAGTITYLSGFDFAAAAGIVEVLVADDRGYYEELCLDVEITPSLSTDNDELVAGGGHRWRPAARSARLCSPPRVPMSRCAPSRSPVEDRSTC